MNVKEKIALWQGMAVKPNPSTVQPVKTTTAEHLPKPKQQPIEKKVQIIHQIQELTKPPHDHKEVKPPQTQNNSLNINTQLHLKQQKFTQKHQEKVVKDEPQKTQIDHKSENDKIPTFSDAKKLLQAKSVGKAVFFQAPPPPTTLFRHVQSDTTDYVGEKAQCQIQKDTPSLSVKEKAAKLQILLQKKNPTQSQTHNQNIQLHYEGEKTEGTNQMPMHEAAKIEGGNCLNVASFQTSGMFQGSIPANQEEGLNSNLSLRFQNKNKKAKQEFNHDDE